MGNIASRRKRIYRVCAMERTFVMNDGTTVYILGQTPTLDITDMVASEMVRDMNNLLRRRQGQRRGLQLAEEIKECSKGQDDVIHQVNQALLKYHGDVQDDIQLLKELHTITSTFNYVEYSKKIADELGSGETCN